MFYIIIYCVPKAGSSIVWMSGSCYLDPPFV